ncbi:MAG: hypothetical protein CL609_08780 [Anaerolineaceae bacterium]|nr:hypothetical protein [Anaerolineaceae bacterium]
MSTLLLSTKLHIPTSQKSAVVRQGLIEKITSAIQAKLILLSAPAGYGKTTLASEVIRYIQKEQNYNVCWFSLDDDDNDIYQFFTYLNEAVKGLPGKENRLNELLQAQQMPAKLLIKAFVSDLLPVSDPFLLVLDDYHVIDSAIIDESLAFMIEKMPHSMKIMMTSRSDPGFPLARLRSRKELIEIRVDDLRFTLNETIQFMQDVMGLSIPDEQVSVLGKRTEGWVAGLQMAGLSMQDRTAAEVSQFVERFSGSHRFVMDYLIDEVFTQLSAVEEHFLLMTAVLNRLSADLCQAILNEGNFTFTKQEGQKMLEHLENKNSFLISLDDQRYWYRYHQLFTDVLLQKTPIKIAQTMRKKAALWSIQNGYIRDAIDYAITAEAWEIAAPLLAENGLTFLFQGNLTLLQNWLDDIPKQWYKKFPRLSIHYAWVLVNQGSFDAVELYLHAAEVDSQRDNSILAVTSLIRANIARAHENIIMLENSVLIALELASAENILSRSASLLQVGALQLMKGEIKKAEISLKDALSQAHQSNNANVVLLAGGYLGLVFLLQESYSEARKTFEEYFDWAKQHSLGQSPLLAYLHLGLAILSFIENNLEKAREHIKLTQEFSRYINEISALYRSNILLFLLEKTTGKNAAIETAWVDLKKAASGLENPEIVEQLHFLETLLGGEDPSTEQIQAISYLAACTSLEYTRLFIPRKQPLPNFLSEREVELLTLIANGLKNQEIANEMFISLNTVLYHTKNIYNKLGVNKRTQAVLKAKELNIL